MMAWASLCLFVATFWIYQRAGSIFKIQAAILWLISGAMFVRCVSSFHETYLYMQLLLHSRR